MIFNKKMLLQNTGFYLSKGTNWILMGNSFVGTPPVKAFGIRIVNSLKLSFPAHFKNTEDNISHNSYSFNLTVGLFPLLNVLSILINEYISRTNLGMFVLTLWACRKSSLIRKIRLNFEIYDVTAWLTKNYNTHVVQYLTS